MGGLVTFFGELKRRNVFRVSAAYIVLAWVLIQVVDIVLPTFGAPEWVGKTITLILFLGFPVAALLAWAFELTPEGIKKTKDVPLEKGIARLAGHKSNAVIIGALLVALVVVVLDNYQVAE